MIQAAEGKGAPAAAGAFSFSMKKRIIEVRMSRIPIDDQVALLMQGTEYGDKTLEATMRRELRERLVEAEKEGRPLRVYCGFDPRTSDLHLGHTVPMRKQRQFQELGHEVTFVVGDYTSLIGDPSDQDKLRPRLTHAASSAKCCHLCRAGLQDPGSQENPDPLQL